jgi:hypothetical protein
MPPAPVGHSNFNNHVNLPVNNPADPSADNNQYNENQTLKSLGEIITNPENKNALQHILSKFSNDIEKLKFSNLTILSLIQDDSLKKMDCFHGYVILQEMILR